MATHRVLLARRAISSFALVLGLLLACVATAVRAAPAADTDAEPIVVAPDSPRAAVSAFLDLCDRARYADAARFLELPRGSTEDGPELARRLDAVLDRRVLLDLESISPASRGNADDGLPKNVDRIAEIAVEEDAEPQPVLLVKRNRASAAWVFTRATVQHIDEWYTSLEDRWLIEHLPARLLRMGPRGLLWWQWIALPIALISAWAGGWMLARLARLALRPPVRRTKTQFDDLALERLLGPFVLFWMLVLSWVELQFLHLLPAAEHFAERVLATGYLLALFWALFRLVDVVVESLSTSIWAHQHPSAKALLPLGARITKVTLFAIGIVAVVANLGYPIASLLAGLGIGGLALALAAQKTVENLFGAFSLGADQPFREGDFVRVENFVGTVELIGLRSTRFRTLDRTLITIPNGKLAEMRLESFAVRDRLRLACMLHLVFETTEEQLRKIIDRCETVLAGHPKIAKDAPTVRFVGIGTSSFDLEVSAYFETSDWSEFVNIRQEVLLEFVRAVEQAGTRLAYPTQTVVVNGDNRPQHPARVGD